MPSTQVKVLVLPVLRRYWLFHAWKEVPPQPPGVKPSWKEAVQAKVMGSFQSQWAKLEAAPHGTFNHKLFKFGQYVMSKVDPSESFLKALPQQADGLEILYPASVASLPERFVRRRLRLLAAAAQPFHASRLRLWIGILLPQLPLIPLPLPNVTIYYTIWRITSNRSAGRGAANLAAALELSSDIQRLNLAQQLLQLQQQGVKLQRGTWAEQLAAEADSLHQQVQLRMASSRSSSSSEHAAAEQQSKQLPLPVFIADKHLEQLVEPAERLLSPLPEAAVLRLAELYDQHHLLEHFRAANRKCLDKNQQQQQQQQPHHHHHHQEQRT
ncbi:mitochondrial K+-H+ exchange-related-domain-containing protein [Scenedesmus sp. NREL 46B-D3]|nr:mitochondrial K+-H+ exchange-related-domain-containing protein [Scenedesmus sp. NREL 46B-D3]